jgi:hypothetical protein
MHQQFLNREQGLHLLTVQELLVHLQYLQV